MLQTRSEFELGPPIPFYCDKRYSTYTSLSHIFNTISRQGPAQVGSPSLDCQPVSEKAATHPFQGVMTIHTWLWTVLIAYVTKIVYVPHLACHEGSVLTWAIMPLHNFLSLAAFTNVYLFAISLFHPPFTQAHYVAHSLLFFVPLAFNVLCVLIFFPLEMWPKNLKLIFLIRSINVLCVCIFFKIIPRFLHSAKHAHIFFTRS